jgi:hypothetical protein
VKRLIERPLAQQKLGAEWMIVGEGGVTQSGSLIELGRSLGVLKNWERLED